MLLCFILTGIPALSGYAQKKQNYKNFGQNFSGKINQPEYTIPNGPYQPNWKSLYKHTAIPEWFRDAKFGIYAHWGVYSVPAFASEWYPRNMYNKKGKVYKHHLKTHGSPLKFGYADFVPMFKARKFDADQWAKLFEEAGAKFAGPVAEHHDGFAMWDSDWTPWNAVDKGPHRDVVGELEQAIRKQGMRFIASFHHARNNLWKRKGKWTGHYSYIEKYFPSVLNDPERAILYGDTPRKPFLEMWRGKLEEVINTYQPDLMWFDFRLEFIPDSVKQKYLAYYFNKAAQWDKEVVVTSKYHQFPDSVGAQDFERGRADKLLETPWLTDDAIGDNSWSYVKNLKLKSTTQLVHELIDIVSKNGLLLLNISPRANGSIPQDQQEILRGIGRWLDQNGEAIYGTRPWQVFGEGPTRLKKGGAFIKNVDYTPKDFRYTRKGNVVYAIQMGWPGAGQPVLLHAWAKNKMLTEVRIRDISVVGSGDTIKWDWKPKGLQITTPSASSNNKAIVFKIVTEQK